jgi:predicted phosphodiesterase
MTFAIISDIHSNKEALDAVLGRIDELGVPTIVCLGDVVGYNADPDACMGAVAARASEVIRGNHDKAAAGLLDLEWFNSAARAAALWTRSAVRPETLERIRQLPAGPREFAQEGSVLLCHGTPYDEDAYLMDAGSVGESFRTLDDRHGGVRFCLVGHTHVPVVVVRRTRSARPEMVRSGEIIDLEPGATYLINPGSVGQPRDGIALASFGILDTDRMTYRNIRVQYDIDTTQRKIHDAGLPASLAHRLEGGR